MANSQDTKAERTVTFRAPVALIEDFQQAAKDREQSMSQALRLHMREYVEQKAKAA